MKTLVALLITIFSFELDKPSPIPSKITELKSRNWYADKAEEWKSYISENEATENDWLNYFAATNYVSKLPEELQNIQTQISDLFPGSFAEYYTAFRIKGWRSEGVEDLESALAIDDTQPISFEDQLIHAELSDKENRSAYSKKLFESGLIHPSTLNYSYNLLMSVEKDGLLILDGLHLTVPIWVLQDVMEVRRDVTILNLELAFVQKEYLSNILNEKGMNTSVDDLLQKEQSGKVYYALTLPRALIDQKEKNLYVVGLATAENSENFNHFEALKTNIEQRFMMDYLTVDFNGEPKTATGKVLSTNYVVPLLLLKEFYDDQKNSARSEELIKMIGQLVVDSQMEARVNLLLSRNKAPRNFKVIDFDVKDLDKNFKQIKGNIYASERELNNKDYWKFMEYLRTNGYDELYEKCYQETTDYDQISQSLMSRYHYSPVNFKELDSRAKKHNMLSYPALDFTYEAAKAYCEWMTVQYNANDKRNFKKVVFRLPSKEEWTMAALGFSGFQSWTLEENVITAKLKEGKAPEEKFDLSEYTIKYPWGTQAWEHRNSISNNFDCFLANVKTDEEITCKAGIKGDGFSFTSPVGTYFPNEMGLFDVIGNVAEMIDEPGVAMGGSWNHEPENSTIISAYEYEESDIKVGMRLFMEVIEE